MNAKTILLPGVGPVAVAIAMIVTDNMVCNTPYMVIVFFAAAVIHLLHRALFIALLQITIYSGGIMVAFLFMRRFA